MKMLHMIIEKQRGIFINNNNSGDKFHAVEMKSSSHVCFTVSFNSFPSFHPLSLQMEI